MILSRVARLIMLLIKPELAPMLKELSQRQENLNYRVGKLEKFKSKK